MCVSNVGCRQIGVFPTSGPNVSLVRLYTTLLPLRFWPEQCLEFVYKGSLASEMSSPISTPSTANRDFRLFCIFSRYASSRKSQEGTYQQRSRMLPYQWCASGPLSACIDCGWAGAHQIGEIKAANGSLTAKTRAPVTWGRNLVLLDVHAENAKRRKTYKIQNTWEPDIKSDGLFINNFTTCRKIWLTSLPCPPRHPLPPPRRTLLHRHQRWRAEVFAKAPCD